MTDQASLFATKLRAWRACNGVHGRMTQAQLADRLDLSIDAIGKYERSLSFIRGDLEHRLTERLGWPREDVIACREDWLLRNANPAPGRYRLLDDAAIAKHFGGSVMKMIQSMMRMVEREIGSLPDELAAYESPFLPVYETYRSHWAAVLHDGAVVATWGLVFLQPEDEQLFRKGRLIEADLNIGRIRRPIFPGQYYAYCPALVIRRGHEAAAPMLLSSFVSFLEELAKREIILRGIGTITVSPGGVRICQELGMIRLGEHYLDPSYILWELQGTEIGQSIFARRSALLRQRYSATFGGA